MKILRYIYIHILIAVFLTTLSACAWIGSFGKVRIQYGDSRMVTIEELKKNWTDYSIAYAGGNMENPSGILFDPRGDDRKIIYDNWKKVEDQKTLSELIGWLSMQEEDGPYAPRLLLVLGPDNKSYGYIYTSWNHMLIKGVDEKTIWIEDLPHPPFKITPSFEAGAAAR